MYSYIYNGSCLNFWFLEEIRRAARARARAHSSETTRNFRWHRNFRLDRWIFRNHTDFQKPQEFQKPHGFLQTWNFRWHRWLAASPGTGGARLHSRAERRGAPRVHRVQRRWHRQVAAGLLLEFRRALRLAEGRRMGVFRQASFDREREGHIRF